MPKNSFIVKRLTLSNTDVRVHGSETNRERSGRVRIGIVGAGYSGSMLAARLLGLSTPHGIDVTLFERSGTFGPGLAYGCARDTNLLNVPAGNMSALDSDPDHFLRYARGIDPTAAPGDFLPRRLYGEYLRHVLDEAQRAAEHAADATPGSRGACNSLERIAGDVVDVIDDQTTRVILADGRAVECDAVVLCLGNYAPGDAWLKGARGSVAPSHPGVVMDPWRANALDGLGHAETDQHTDVLLVGTGLTMVDVVTELRARGHAGVIHAVSRRGLMPASHRSPTKPPKSRTPLVDLSNWDGTTRSLLRIVRRAVDAAAKQGVDWRDVIASLRSITQDTWQRLNDRQKARFLRLVRPYWDVARHRLAPQVAAKVDAWRGDGSLRVHAGRVEAINIAASPATGTALDVRLRSTAPSDGAIRVDSLRVARIFNCTGPESDMRRVGQPLIQALIARGVVRPDSLCLGIDCTREGAAIDAAGSPSTRLFVVGPLRKGLLWETTAVPELRVQVSELARSLATIEPAAALPIGTIEPKSQASAPSVA